MSGPVVGKSGCTFTVEGDMIVKHLLWDMADTWLPTYKKLREFEPRLVEVYGYEDRKIYMKYIQGSTLLDSMSVNYYLEACDIMKNIGIYCLNNNVTFINHATQLRNFMVEANTNKVYMIDVDSFHHY